MTATVTNPVTTSSSSSQMTSSLHPLSYPGLSTAYSSHLNWQLHRNTRQHAQPNYYESNSYYNAWFSNYKAQWRHHWQKYRGNVGGRRLEKRSSSLLAVKCEFRGLLGGGLELGYGIVNIKAN